MTDSEKLDLLLEKVKMLEQHMDDMDIMKQDIQESKKDIANIRFRIENEICESIQRIAKRQLGLTRKLYEIVILNSELEVLSVMVRGLQTDVREIKQNLS